MTKNKHECTVCGDPFDARCINTACVVGYHNVRSIEPNAVRDDRDPLEDMRDALHKLGRAAGIEEVCNALRDRAARAFLANDDKRATCLRDIAAEFSGRVTAIRNASRALHVTRNKES